METLKERKMAFLPPSSSSHRSPLWGSSREVRKEGAKNRRRPSFLFKKPYLLGDRFVARVRMVLHVKKTQSQSSNESMVH